MSKQEPSEQVRFLVACIKHTTNGRPDFSAVATELDIVSKAAAQKRYERMLKANNVGNKPAGPKGSNDEEETPKPKRTVKATPAKRKAPAKNGRASKKAKIEDDSESDVKDKKPAKPAATAAKGKGKANKVKKEEEQEEEAGEEDSASALSEAPEADDETDIKSTKSEE